MKNILVIALLFVNISAFSQQGIKTGRFTFAVSKDTSVTLFTDLANMQGNCVWSIEFDWNSLNTTSVYITPQYGLHSLINMGLQRGGVYTDTIKIVNATGSTVIWGDKCPTGSLSFTISHGTNATGTLKWYYYAKKQ